MEQGRNKSGHIRGGALEALHWSGITIGASRLPCCVLLALSWNTNENPSTDKLSRAINYIGAP